MSLPFTLTTKKQFLLINPYACDFTCYDYWLKPLGLLYISSLLKLYGHKTVLVDCLHRSFGAEAYGKGRIDSMERERPDVLNGYPRKYSNYGIFGKKLHNILKQIESPDMILLSTSMTYWYPAAAETAEILRNIFPGVKIAAGGSYVTLCPDHARENIDADYFFEGADITAFMELIGEKPASFEEWPAPDYSHYGSLDYAVTRTSGGCGRSCPYCGISRIWKGFFTRKAEAVKKELKSYYSRGIKDIAFYDDALLENPALEECLESIPEAMRFHTPNGINPSAIDNRTALFMRKSGFISPALAADTLGSAGQSKTTALNIESAVEKLHAAGYGSGEISAYLIMGLPRQRLGDLLKEAVFLNRLGVRVLLAEYAVVPGSGYDEIIDPKILKEPLLHNNSIFPCIKKERESIPDIKIEVSRLNGEL